MAPERVEPTLNVQTLVNHDMQETGTKAITEGGPD